MDDGWVDGWMDEGTEGWTDKWMDKYIYGCFICSDVPLRCS